VLGHKITASAGGQVPYLAAATGTYLQRLTFRIKTMNTFTKCFAATCVGLIIGMSTADAQTSYMDGAELYEWCMEKDQLPANVYIQGAHDGLSFMSDRICVPKGTKATATAVIVCRWLHKHPEKWTYPAGGVVALALLEKYPCQQQDSSPAWLEEKKF
jgi:hypothetical protein